MAKLVVGVGVTLTTVGAILLLTISPPTHAQLDGGYGDVDGSLQRIGGAISLGLGVLALLVAFVRSLKAGKHDPDLPPEYRV